MEAGELDDLLARYREHGDLLATLKEARIMSGGLTPDLIAQLASRLDICVGDLYGIVSFYSFLSVAPVGRHTLRLCRSVPCRMGNGEAIRAALERSLRVKPGETTGDGKFTLELTSCIGACGQAPAMMVDERRIVSLSETDIADHLAAFD